MQLLSRFKVGDVVCCSYSCKGGFQAAYGPVKITKVEAKVTNPDAGLAWDINFTYTIQDLTGVHEESTLYATAQEMFDAVKDKMVPPPPPPPPQPDDEVKPS
jgi:hypothetical protein